MRFEFKKREEAPFIVACATATQEGSRVVIGEIVTDEVLKLAANLENALQSVIDVIIERTGLPEDTVLSIIAGMKCRQTVVQSSTIEKIKAVRSGRR